MVKIDKLVVITKKTALEELVERFNTIGQAKFYLEHMGADFREYQLAHDEYYKSIEFIRGELPAEIPVQFIERTFLPTVKFSNRDLIITVGPDGLVINVAKYLQNQPIIALNPDEKRIDGVLIPFNVREIKALVRSMLDKEATIEKISMAKAELNDGQMLYAVNDFFIGHITHASARYRLIVGKESEDQSSSGIIVSTGVGSTGWFRSILKGAAEITGCFKLGQLYPRSNETRFPWNADYLYYIVREPFESRISGATLVCGKIQSNAKIKIISQMPQGGIIFSDGILSDYLQFNSAAILQISLAERNVNLVVGYK